MPCSRSPVGGGVYPSMHSGPGPHPRGKWRGIRSRPTPKGEIEGDQVQAHTQGGNWRGIRSRPTPKGEIEGGSDPGPPPEQTVAYS